jgi:hypothetical protein
MKDGVFSGSRRRETMILGARFGLPVRVSLQHMSTMKSRRVIHAGDNAFAPTNNADATTLALAPAQRACIDSPLRELSRLR